LEAVFSAWSVPRSYLEDNWGEYVRKTYLEYLEDTATLLLRIEIGVRVSES
jgi:hypothetical protein